MKRSIKVDHKKKRGRPATGRDPMVSARIPAATVGAIDAWARRNETTRSGAIALLVELTSEIERLPDESRERPILGVPLPLVSIDAMTASAPSKVALALDRMGLEF